MLGVLLDREMPRRNRVAPKINPHCTARVKADLLREAWRHRMVQTRSRRNVRAGATRIPSGVT